MQRTYETASLPLCDLHYVRMGSGPPLIIVPATISDMNDWLGLAGFLAQGFTTFFFDLPGHGKSTSLAQYSSQHVARVIADLADHLGYERFNLMGFSFGGILALTTLNRLSDRIDSITLISPLVDSDAIKVSWPNRLCLHALTALIQPPWVQRMCYRSMQSELGARLWVEFLVRVGNVEHRHLMTRRLSEASLSTVQTLAGQAKEIMRTHHFRSMHYGQPCYFAMSYRDPLLDFAFTSTAVKRMFATVDEIRLDLPYHQPPEPPTISYLNDTYHHLLDRMSLHIGG